MTDIIPVVSANTFVGPAPLKVSFSSTGSKSLMGSIVSYEWDFGDGQKSTLKNPTHTFVKPGEYTTTLYLTNNVGDVVSSNITIRVVEVQSIITIKSDRSSIGLVEGRNYNLPVLLNSKQEIDIKAVQIVIDIDRKAFKDVSHKDIDFKNSLFNSHPEVILEEVDVTSSKYIEVSYLIEEVLDVQLNGTSIMNENTTFYGSIIELDSPIMGIKKVRVKYKSSKIMYALAEIESGYNDVQRIVIAVSSNVKDPVLINNGDITTNSRRVILSFNVPEAVEVQVWNNESINLDLSQATPPSNTEWKSLLIKECGDNGELIKIEKDNTMIWDLWLPTTGEEIEGTKFVYCRFRDKDGNYIGDPQGKPFTASIILDYSSSQPLRRNLLKLGPTDQEVFRINLQANESLGESFKPIRFITSYALQARSKILDSTYEEKFYLSGNDILISKAKTMVLSLYDIAPSVEEAKVTMNIGNLDPSLAVESSVRFVNGVRYALEVWKLSSNYKNGKYIYEITTRRPPVGDTMLFCYAYDQSRNEYLPLFCERISSNDIFLPQNYFLLKRSENIESTLQFKKIDTNKIYFEASHYVFVWRDREYNQDLGFQRHKDENEDIAGIQVSRTLKPLTEDSFYFIDTTIRDSSGYELNTTNLVNNGLLSPWKLLFNTLPDIKAPIILPESKLKLVDLSGITVDTNSVTIEWYTNEPSTSEVIYFCNPRFIKKNLAVFVKDGSGNIAKKILQVDIVDPSILQREYDPKRSTYHKITLKNLSSGTKYYYKIKSTDAKGNYVEAPIGDIKDSTLPFTQEKFEQIISTIEGQKSLLYTDLQDVIQGREPYFYEFVTKIDLTVKYITSCIIDDINNPGQYMITVPIRELYNIIQMGSYGSISRLTMSPDLTMGDIEMKAGPIVDEAYLENPDPISLIQNEYEYYTNNPFYALAVEATPSYIYLIDNYTLPRSTQPGYFKDLDGDGIGDSWDNKAYIANPDSYIELRAITRKPNLIAGVWYNEVELYNIEDHNIVWTGYTREFIDYFDNIDVKNTVLTLRLIPINNHPLDIVERVFNERHKMSNGKIIIYRLNPDENTIYITNFKSGRNYELNKDFSLVVTSDRIEIHSITIPDNVELLVNYTYTYKTLVCTHLKDEQSPTSNGHFVFSSRELYYNL